MKTRILQDRRANLRNARGFPEQITYEIWLDETRAHDLAVKAAGNKSGGAVDGALSAVITRRQLIQADEVQS